MEVLGVRLVVANVWDGKRMVKDEGLKVRCLKGEMFDVERIGGGSLGSKTGSIELFVSGKNY